MLAQEPHSIHKYGREWRVGAERFPVSQTMTGVVLDLEPGGLRELHWHPNADEWQYVIEGQYSVSLFGSHGRYRTETLNQGDVAYIPQGYGHSIENVGAKPGRLLLGFNSGYYQAIDSTQWLAAVPPYLLADHFGKPKEAFEAFPRQRAFICPPDGLGRREVK
jgi:oxalate decarboxylase